MQRVMPSKVGSTTPIALGRPMVIPTPNLYCQETKAEVRMLQAPMGAYPPQMDIAQVQVLAPLYLRSFVIEYML